MNNSTDVISRLLEFCKDNNYSQSEFAKAINMEQKTVNSYLNGSRKISFAFINAVIRTFGLNANWLLSGDEKWYEKATNELSTDSIYPAKPFIDSSYAACGSPKGFNISIKAEDCEKLSLPLMANYDFSIMARGDSMICHCDPKKTINSGDIIACRIWRSRNHIQWGELYALATTNGVIVKKLIPSEKEGCVKCVSYNEKEGHLPFDLPYEEITDWALVVGIVSVKILN